MVKQISSVDRMKSDMAEDIKSGGPDRAYAIALEMVGAVVGQFDTVKDACDFVLTCPFLAAEVIEEVNKLKR